METIDWNVKLKEALDRTEFLALATTGEKHIWVNPVSFAYSESLELFFISMVDSVHVQNLIKEPRIAAAIFKTERFPDGDVLGLQLTGTAVHVTEQAEIERAAKYYFERGTNNEEFRSQTSEKGDAQATWQFFRITPTEMWCFDSREFGEQRRQVPLENLQVDLHRHE